ncbi:MAG: hypothetical protein R3B13_01765 [Polyangiaceae bacterium]
MTLEHNLDTLLEETTPALRKALQTAYELGYRAALAQGASTTAAVPGSPSPSVSAPAGESATASSTMVEDDDFEPEDAPPSVAPPPPDDDDDDDSPAAGSSDGVDWSALDGSLPTEPRPQRKPVVRPIRPHATVGTLRHRIVTGFELERFDIDVVICRKGDRTRRQLKQTVKLSKYALEAT